MEQMYIDSQALLYMRIYKKKKKYSAIYALDDDYTQAYKGWASAGNNK